MPLISNTVTGPYRSTVPKSTVGHQKPATAQTSSIMQTTAAPTTTRPPVASSSNILGQYQGRDIYAGQDVGEQMRAIDSSFAAKPTTTPSISNPQPVKGLLADKAPILPQPTTPTYSGLVQNLTERAQSPSKEMEDAFKAQQRAAKNLREFRSSAADTVKGIYSAPSSAKVMQGREAAVQRANAEIEAALGSELQSATDLYNAAITSQGQQLGALGTAAGLAAPVQIAPGSTLTAPFEGETIAGGLGGYVNYQTAEQVMNLIRQYPDAGYVYDATKTPQQNLQTFQNQALQRSPSYQKSIYGQPGATSVVGAAGLSSAADLTQQASELQAAANGAEANFALLVDTARRGGVNNTNVPVLNTLQQNLNRGLTSSAAVASFRQLLEDVRMQYAVILGGGSVTDSARAQANAQVPDDVSLATLMELEKSMKSAATNRIQGINQQISSISQGSVGSNTAKVGNYSYQLVNGKWQLVQ